MTAHITTAYGAEEIDQAAQTVYNISENDGGVIGLVWI